MEPRRSTLRERSTPAPAAPTTEDRRHSRVKALALEQGGPQAELVRKILSPEGGVPPASPVVMHLAGELRRVRADGLGAYLAARQLIATSEFRAALPLVIEARALGLPTGLLHREARRMFAIALFASDHLTDAAELWRGLEAEPNSPRADVADATDWLERIRWTQAHPRRQVP